MYTQAQVDSLYRALRATLDVKFDPNDPDVATRGGREGGGLRPEEVYWARDNQVAPFDGEPRSSLIQFPELRTLPDRCLIFHSNGGPPMLPNNTYNDNYTIVHRRAWKTGKAF